MPLKYKIAKLEDVPEALRTEYKPDPAGGFVLDAEGVVPKERVDEFRNNNIQLQQQLDKLKDIDPVKYKELTVLQRKIQEKEYIEAGEVEKAVNLRVDAMREEKDSQIKTLTETATTQAAQLTTLLINNVVKDAAIKSGVVPTAVDDVVLRATTMFKIENGVPVAKNAKGEIVYGKDGKTPMSVPEWVVDLKKTAPHLFQGAVGSGAGGGHHVGGADTSKLSAVGKIAAGLDQLGLAKLPGS